MYNNYLQKDKIFKVKLLSSIQWVIIYFLIFSDDVNWLFSLNSPPLQVEFGELERQSFSNWKRASLTMRTNNQHFYVITDLLNTANISKYLNMESSYRPSLIWIGSSGGGHLHVAGKVLHIQDSQNFLHNFLNVFCHRFPENTQNNSERRMCLCGRTECAATSLDSSIQLRSSPPKS